MFSRKKVTFSAFMHKHRKCSVFSTQLSPPPTSFLSIYMTKPNNYFFLSPPSDSLQCNYTVRSNTTHTHTKWERGNWFTISVVLIVIFNTSVTAQRKINGMWEQLLVFLESFWFNCAHTGTQIHTHTLALYARGNHCISVPFITSWHAAPVTCMTEGTSLQVCMYVCVCVRLSLCVHAPRRGKSLTMMSFPAIVVSFSCSKQTTLGVQCKRRHWDSALSINRFTCTV